MGLQTVRLARDNGLHRGYSPASYLQASRSVCLMLNSSLVKYQL